MSRKARNTTDEDSFVVCPKGNVSALPLGPDAKNITIFDNREEAPDYVGENVGREDNETEPGTIRAQQWDLEAFFLEGSALTMVGGFDFKDGYSGYAGGDLFIDLDGDAQYGYGGKTAPAGYPTWGYEYAVKFDNFTLVGDGEYVAGYSVYDLSASSTVFDTSRPSDIPTSAPWRVQQGKVVNGGSGRFWEELSDSQVGLLDGTWKSGDTLDTHYALQLDLDQALSFLSGGYDPTPGFNPIFHYTMECGNDNLMGRDPVPEPGTLLLLGAGLIGLLAFGRKRIKK